MNRCAVCGGRLFVEPTEDGLEAYDLAGHRFPVVEQTPLPIPTQPSRPERYRERENGPRIGMMKL